MPLLTLDHVSLAYGHLPLLDDVALQLEAGERICIIGRNGTGKSTLLQILSGELVPDSGTIWRAAGAPDGAPRAGRAALGPPLGVRRRRRRARLAERARHGVSPCGR